MSDEWAFVIEAVVLSTSFVVAFSVLRLVVFRTVAAGQAPKPSAAKGPMFAEECGLLTHQPNGRMWAERALVCSVADVPFVTGMFEPRWPLGAVRHPDHPSLGAIYPPEVQVVGDRARIRVRYELDPECRNADRDPVRLGAPAGGYNSNAINAAEVVAGLAEGRQMYIPAVVVADSSSGSIVRAYDGPDVLGKLARGCPATGSLVRCSCGSGRRGSYCPRCGTGPLT